MELNHLHYISTKIFYFCSNKGHSVNITTFFLHSVSPISKISSVFSQQFTFQLPINNLNFQFKL